MTSIEKIDDQTLVTADMARKAIAQVQTFVRGLLEDNIPQQKVAPEKIEAIIEQLTTGRVTHDHPISVEEAEDMGLPITVGLPKEIYTLMELYPQPMNGRPSVQYIPLPYQNPPTPPTKALESSATHL